MPGKRRTCHGQHANPKNRFRSLLAWSHSLSLGSGAFEWTSPFKLICTAYFRFPLYKCYASFAAIRPSIFFATTFHVMKVRFASENCLEQRFSSSRYHAEKAKATSEFEV